MTLSILNRITGVGLSLGLIVLAVWLTQVAAGPEQYQYIRATMGSPLGKLMLIGWTFAFFLHLGNGIRHLVWDMALGFEIRQANASAWAVLILSTALTAGFWAVKF